MVLVGIAVLFSKNRKAINWRLVGFGLLLQILFGVLVTQVPLVADGFAFVSKLFVKLLSFSQAIRAAACADLVRSVPDVIACRKFLARTGVDASPSEIESWSFCGSGHDGGLKRARTMAGVT